MADEADPRLKNPYAIPAAALVGDGGVSQDQLVILQPHQHHSDWVPCGTGDAGGAGGAGGDGD